MFPPLDSPRPERLFLCPAAASAQTGSTAFCSTLLAAMVTPLLRNRLPAPHRLPWLTCASKPRVPPARNALPTTARRLGARAVRANPDASTCLKRRLMAPKGHPNVAKAKRAQSDLRPWPRPSKSALKPIHRRARSMKCAITQSTLRPSNPSCWLGNPCADPSIRTQCVVSVLCSRAPSSASSLTTHMAK